MDRAARISGQMPGYERQVTDDWVVVDRWTASPGRGGPLDGGWPRRHYGDESYHVLSDWQFGQPLFRGTVNGAGGLHPGRTAEHGLPSVPLGIAGRRDGADRRAAELLACMPVKEPPDMSRFLLSPMPGLLAQMTVDVGREVKSGQDLAVVEAMKMENVLCAERDGKVLKVLAGVGDTLAVDQPILEFE